MLLIGHRGARGEAPENTVEAFRHARVVGVRAVEFDVRLTADDHIVVMHDRDVDRTTDGTGAVADLSLEQIRRLDARADFADWPVPCPVPTFRETLEATADFEELLVEIKSDEPARLVRLIPDVVDELARQDAADRVIVTSFDITALAIVREVSPALRRGFIGKWDSSAALTVARLLGCHQVDAQVSTASQPVLEAARTAGLRIVGWPCRTDDEFDTLTRWGVDAATTDYPSRFLMSVQDGNRSV